VSAWHDLVTASLIGTERSVVPAAGLDGLPSGADDAGDPAALLLDRAALMTAARRAGRRPDGAEPLPVCEPDRRPAVSPAAAARLAHMLDGTYRGLLAEWLRAITERGLRLPPQFLPVLLDQAARLRSRDPALAHLVAEAGGARARWLAALNPEWDFVTAPALTGDDAWRLGSSGQRRDYLAALVARDPDGARELVKRSWEAARPAERTMFLSVLADGLGPAAEPLLEAALDDRGEVQAWAASRLARLPGSALGQRMAGRALHWVRMERGPGGMRLIITPPAECDASMLRDGIMPGPAAARTQQAGQARLLLQVMGQTPVRTWTDEFGLTAAHIVALRSGGWDAVLFTGWAQAATVERDHDWIAALIGQALAGRPPRTHPEITALERLARRADPVLGAPGALPEPEPDARPAVSAALDVLRFRYEMHKELDHDHSG
jgi:Family of unknown function (DUF5691)